MNAFLRLQTRAERAMLCVATAPRPAIDAGKRTRSGVGCSAAPPNGTRQDILAGSLSKARSRDARHPARLVREAGGELTMKLRGLPAQKCGDVERRFLGLHHLHCRGGLCRAMIRTHHRIDPGWRRFRRCGGRCVMTTERILDRA